MDEEADHPSLETLIPWLRHKVQQSQRLQKTSPELPHKNTRCHELSISIQKMEIHKAACLLDYSATYLLLLTCIRSFFVLTNIDPE
jgi:hypothetical protein